MEAEGIVDVFAPVTRVAPCVVVGIEVNGQVQVTSLGADGDTCAEETIFEIGSITKTFTALLLAEMAQRNEVALDDPASKFVRTQNQALSQVTLVDLATHTARFPRVPRDLWGRALRNHENPYHDYCESRLENALSRIRARRGVSKRVRYSNFGYATLGYVLSKVAGVPYEHLIDGRLCDPLGLDSTSFALASDLEQRFVRGHKKRGREVSRWDLVSFAPAGGLKSSVGDLLTYVRAHVHPGNSPLAGSLTDVQQPRVDIRKGRLAVGLAWFIGHHKGMTIAWHGAARAASVRSQASLLRPGCPWLLWRMPK